MAAVALSLVASACGNSAAAPASEEAACTAFASIQTADEGQLATSETAQHLRTLWVSDVGEVGPSVRMVADSYATLRGIELAVPDFRELDLQEVESMFVLGGSEEEVFEVEQAARAWYQNACGSSPVPRPAFSFPPVESPQLSFCEAREALSSDGELRAPDELDIATTKVRAAVRALHEHAPAEMQTAASRYREQAFILAGLEFREPEESDGWLAERKRLTSGSYERTARELDEASCGE